MAKVLIGNFKGPQGGQGIPGPQGEQGDQGIRGSRWTEGTAITGTSTTPTVFSGTGISDALAEDMYLNTDTGNAYRCTTGGVATVAKWVYACNLKGIKGDTGAKGDPGTAGPKGEKGDTGEQGPKGDTPTVADNMTVAFTQASSRSNIATGEKLSVIMGKIKKFFADLTAPAFAQMITTKEDLLATKVTGYVPDAKAVADTYTELNGNLNEIEGKIDNSIKKVNIHHSGTTEVEYTLPQNIGLNDVIICNSSFGGVSGTTFVLGGYALYYSAFSTHVAYTIPAPNSTSSNATSTVTLIAQNKIKVKCNNANAFCSVTVIMGGNSAN